MNLKKSKQLNPFRALWQAIGFAVVSSAMLLTCCFLVIYRYNVTHRPVPAFLSTACIVRVRPFTGQKLPFRCGIGTCSNLRVLLSQSSFANVQSPLTKIYELSFFNGTTELLQVPVYVYTRDPIQQPSHVIFKWEGQFRKADYSDWLATIEEPNSEVEFLSSSRYIRYEDKNDDGKIDSKIQIINSREDILSLIHI